MSRGQQRYRCVSLVPEGQSGPVDIVSFPGCWKPFLTATLQLGGPVDGACWACLLSVNFCLCDALLLSQLLFYSYRECVTCSPTSAKHKQLLCLNGSRKCRLHCVHGEQSLFVLQPLLLISVIKIPSTHRVNPSSSPAGSVQH